MTTSPSDGSPDAATPAPLVLVVPEHRPLQDILPPVTALAETCDVPLVLVRPLIVPRQTPLDAVGEEQLGSHRRDLEALEEAARDIEQTIEVRSKVLVGRNVDHVIETAARNLEALAVVVPGLFPTGPDEILGGGDLEAIMDAVDAPTVVYREPTAPQRIDSVLAAIAGGPHSEAVASWAARFARAHDCTVDLVHVLDPGTPRETGVEALEEAADLLAGSDVEARKRRIEADDVVDALLDELEEGDALVVGAPTRNRLQHVLYGSTSRRLQQGALAWRFTVHSG